ncbi:MAG: hypothetical protein EZS28_020065, partial [Streblomastix strix]
MKTPTIPEVEPQFEKEADAQQIDPFQQLIQQLFQQQVIICETPTLSARRRSSIFEETLTADPSVYRWLLDIISEEEHMTKESVHFVLSEIQLIRVVAYTFDIPESQIQLSREDEGCCEALDPYNREEIDEMLEKKLNISEKIDVYTKQEDDALLLLKADKSELIDEYSKTEDDELFAIKLVIADYIDVYTKQEIDALHSNKLNTTDQIDAYSKIEDDALLLLKDDKAQLIDAYTKAEDDALLLLKTDKSELIDAYSKTDVDALLDDKLNITDQIDAYIKQEDDALLLLKANITELDNYVDLTSTQTISELREIASGKPKRYVFATTNEISTWIDDQETVAKLALGDNLHIVNKQIMDYWWDGTDLRAFETELPDMSQIMTILGTATGGEQKTFNSTIHSVEIMVQNYDNNSVVCADSGVKAIQDINVSILDEAMLLEADKTELIDAFSKTEADAFLDDKLYVSDQINANIKQEDDALQLLNADKSLLIDAYTKGEADNLLCNKVNSGVSYSKGENNALLLLKADKKQLIDAYTKIETNNLLNNKADSGVSYTKGKDDVFLLLKADKTQLIDAYTKGEADNLLNNKVDSGVLCTNGEDDDLLLLKANQSTTYTKIETDYLISLIKFCDVDLSGSTTLSTSQTITANKTFNNACRFVSSLDEMSLITGSLFIKSGADDSDILLGAGGTNPISEFSSSVDEPTDDDYITLGAVQSEFVSSIYSGSINGNLTATQFIQSGKDDISSTSKQEGFAPSMSIKIGILPTQCVSTVSEFYMSVGDPYGRFKHHITNTGEIRCYTVGASWIEQISFSDERLLDAAGLSDFPELCAYIKELYPKPFEQQLHPIPIGDQALQQQVKNNEDIINGSGDGSNEVFEPPVSNAITKLDLSSQLQRQSFLASSGSDPQLIVYDDRFTLTASYATTGLFPCGCQLDGYLFKSYPPDARSKLGDSVIALVGTYISNTYNIFCYIDQNGPYIQYAPDNYHQILLSCLTLHIIN